MSGCGARENIGHGATKGCGEDFYGTIWICDKCRFEQLQALTKEFAEGIVNQVNFGCELDLWSKEFLKAQQYLDSLKESV